MVDISSADVENAQTPQKTLQWEVGTYRLSGLFVLRESDREAKTADGKRFELMLTIVRNAGADVTPWYWALTSPPSADFKRDLQAKRSRFRGFGGGMNGGNGNAVPYLAIPKTGGQLEFVLEWNRVYNEFGKVDVRADQTNELRFVPPEDLIKAIRERLKAREMPQGKTSS